MIQKNNKIDIQEFLIRYEKWRVDQFTRKKNNFLKRAKKKIKGSFRRVKSILLNYNLSNDELAVSSSDHNTSYTSDHNTSYNRENKCVDADKTLAIIVHAHYYDIFTSIMERVATLDIDFKLYVTTNKLNYDLICDYFCSRVYNVDILCTENLGRDILPFIKILPYVKQQHNYLLKLHTKKSPHRGRDGQAWREKMLDELLNEKLIQNINMLFKDYPIGIIGPANYIYSVRDKSHSSLGLIKDMARKMNFDGNIYDELFVGGTMFYASVDALEPICKLNFKKDQFPPEPLPLDGTTAHGIERLIGISSTKQSLLTVDTKFCKDLI